MRGRKLHDNVPEMLHCTNAAYSFATAALAACSVPGVVAGDPIFILRATSRGNSSMMHLHGAAGTVEARERQSEARSSGGEPEAAVRQVEGAYKTAHLATDQK